MTTLYNPSTPETVGLEWAVDSEFGTVVLDSATKGFAQVFPGEAFRVSQSIAAYAELISDQGVFGVDLYSAPYVTGVPQQREVKYAGTDTGADFTSPYNGNAAWLTAASGAASYASVSPGVADVTYLKNVNQVEGPTPCRMMIRGAANAATAQLAGKRILSVEVHVVVKCTLSTAPSFAGNLNLGGTDYTARTVAIPINVGYTDQLCGYWELNPQTGLPWTLEQINNIVTAGATDEFGLVGAWNASYTANYADTIRVQTVYLIVRTQPEDRIGYAYGTVNSTGWKTWPAKSVPNLLSKQDANNEVDAAGFGSWVALNTNSTVTNDTDDPGAPWTRSIKVTSVAAGDFGIISGFYPFIALKTGAFRHYSKVTAGRPEIDAILCYDANGSLLGTLPGPSDNGTGAYKATGMTAAAAAPVGTTQVKVRITVTATAGAQTIFSAGRFLGLDQSALNFVRDAYTGALAKIKVDGAAEVAEVARGLNELDVFRRISGSGSMSMPLIAAGASAVGMPLNQESRSVTLQDGAGALLTVADASTLTTAVLSTSLYTYDLGDGPTGAYSQAYAGRLSGGVYTGNTIESELSLPAGTFVAVRLVVAGQVDVPAANLSLKLKDRRDGSQVGGTALIAPTDLERIIPPGGGAASRSTPQVFVATIPTPAAVTADFGYDTGDRGNNAASVGTSDSGQTPTAAVGTFGIINNEIYRPTSGGAYDLLIWSAPGAVNGWAEMTLGSVAQDNQFLVYRYVDTSNFWYVTRVSGFATWNIYKRIAGVDTFVTNVGLNSTAVGTIVRAVYQGNNHWIYIDGRLATTFSDSQFAGTGTKVGIGCLAAVTSAARWNGFRWGAQHYVEASSTAASGSGWTLYALDTLGGVGGSPDSFSADNIVFGGGVDAWTDPANGGRQPHRNGMVMVQTRPAAPAGVTATVVGDHINVAWTATGIGAAHEATEVWVTNDRAAVGAFPGDGFGYQQVADLTNEAEVLFSHVEPRRGVSAVYMVRTRRTDGSLSPFSTPTAAVHTPNTGADLLFVSGEAPFSMYVSGTGRGDVTWEPPDERVIMEFAGRSGAVAFLGIEEPYDEWDREVMLYWNGNFLTDACAPGEPPVSGRAAFNPLETLTRASLSYVCVLDRDGNRWFASVALKSATQQSDGGYIGALHMRELTRTPSTPTTSPA